MDRRTKQRLDLQLLCHLGAGAVCSAPVDGVTENISRDGILMRWMPTAPPPEIGSSLTVEFSLPESEEFGKRLMRCQTTVVRIKPASDGHTAVALRINTLRFVPVPGSRMPRYDLQSMAVVSERVC